MTTQPTTSPQVAELQDAADKLRALATARALPPGPWHVHNRGGYPEAVYAEISDTVLAESTDDLDAPKPTASYIAAMHPGVATALADWLEREARQERYTLAEFGHRIAPPEALAVARAINPAPAPSGSGGSRAQDGGAQ